MIYIDHLGYLRLLPHQEKRRSKSQIINNEGKFVFLVKSSSSGNQGRIGLGNKQLITKKWLIGKRVRIKIELVGDEE